MIEATQFGEVVFTVIGGLLLLGEPIPGPIGWFGLALIVGRLVAGNLLATAVQT